MASLASGSAGNCTYIGTDETHILIDAGISMKKTGAALSALGLSFEDIDAIFITHEHSDHIAGLPVIEKYNEIPVYLTSGTAGGVILADRNGVIGDGLLNTFRPGDIISIGDLEIGSFAIPHDAAEPVAYSVLQPDTGKRAAVATDIGHVCSGLREFLSGRDALLLEANHDIRMLQAGPYPYRLKQRILSDSGHLSNDAAGELITGILHDGLKGLMLGHLSEINNLPELAFETVRVEIELSDTEYGGNDFPIMVAPRSELSEIIEF